MRKKYEIELRTKDSCVPGKLFIKRVIWGEVFGNFNPFFCRYNGKRYLVKSDCGDLSDPFRRDESYAKSFFIEI